MSHDLNVVRLLTDRVAVMYLGKIVEPGPSEAVFRAPHHPYTQALVSAIPGQGPRIKLTGEVSSPIDPPAHVCRFHGRCPQGEDRCARETPLLCAWVRARSPATLRNEPGGTHLPHDADMSLSTAASSATALPAQRANLAEQVYAQLKAELHDFTWVPGDRFSEAEIGQRVGVSRTPVREALFRLRNEGFLDVESKSGWFVKPSISASSTSSTTCAWCWSWTALPSWCRGMRTLRRWTH